MSSVKVAVRVRPFNNRERDRNAELIVTMQGNMTLLKKPKDQKASTPQADDEKKFSYDFSYWSFDPESPNYAGQQTVFNDLGRDVLKNAWEGFNCSIFAYGQTGSGKSYSMLGYGEDKGIIPLVCEEMFERINARDGPDEVIYKVEVSFMEIYNEKVKDLLNPKNNKQPGGLKVRNHPTTGPYVEDLSKLAVKGFQEIEMLMDEGSKARTVASTNMNATSSRSHAVFTIVFTQTIVDRAAGTATERVSKVSLVDLAGSERAASTGATGVRLKEGANINKSLSTLGKVISALAENSGNPKKMQFVPYRDSVLTWLLKESLGGNAKTIMIAAISPADINYEETLSTLRYADSAKKIKNAAVINEDPKARLIRDLQEEVERLRSMLGSGGIAAGPSNSYDPDGDIEVVDLRDKLEQSEKLMAELNKSWEDKLREAQLVREERMAALKDMGVAIKVVSSVPHLINLNEDPLMTESLIYYLPKGVTRVGRPDADVAQDIVLSGLSIQREHCKFEHDEDGTVSIIPPDADMLVEGHSFIYVNGVEITEARVLTQGARVVLGYNHMFRFNHPEEAARIARERSSQETKGVPAQQIIDYNFALRELASAQGKLLINRVEDEYNGSNEAKPDDEMSFPVEKEKLIKDVARKWRERVERGRLERQISSMILLLNEGNAISQTLGKPLRFELNLMSLFSEVGQDPDPENAFLSWNKTQVGVKVHHVSRPEFTIVSTSEYADMLARMRDQYLNYFEGVDVESYEDAEGGGAFDDPFSIPLEEHREVCIGKSILYPKDLIYGFDISRDLAVIDQFGQTRASINVEIRFNVKASVSGEATVDQKDEMPSTETPRLEIAVGKPFEVTLKVGRVTGLTGEYLSLMSKYTFRGETVESPRYDRLDFAFERTIRIDDVTQEVIANLESGMILVELWGIPATASSESSESGTPRDGKKLMESFEFVANLNVLEPERAATPGPSPSSSSVQESSDPHYAPVPTEEEPEQLALDNLPGVLFRLRKDRPRRMIELKIAKSDPKLCILGCKSVIIAGIRLVGKGSQTSRPNTTDGRSTPVTPGTFKDKGKERMEMQVQDTTDDMVRCYWDAKSGIFTQKTRKGERIVLTVVWLLEFRNFGPTVEIKKEISVKVHSPADSSENVLSRIKPLLTTPDGTSTSAATPMMYTPNGSFFSVMLTKSREVEQQSRIVHMIDTHQESLMKLGNTLQIERLRQEIELRKKLDGAELEVGTDKDDEVVDSSPYKPKRATSPELTEESNHLNLPSPNNGSMSRSNSYNTFDPLNSARSFTADPPSNEALVKQMQNLMVEKSQLDRAFPHDRLGQSRPRSESFVQVRVNEVDSSELREHEANGWLRKKSNFKDTWKERWFVLRKSYLYYFVDRSLSKKDKRRIDLSTTSVVVVPHQEFPLTFALVSVNHVWLLQASTESELQMWLVALDPATKLAEMKDAELKQVQSAMQSQTDLAQQLQDRIDTLQKDLQSKDSTIGQLSNSVHEQAQQLKAVDERLVDAMKTNSTLIAENAEMKELVAQVESSVPPLKESLNSLTAQLQSLDQEKIELQARDSHHVEAVRALTHECEKQKVEIERLTIEREDQQAQQSDLSCDQAARIHSLTEENEKLAARQLEQTQEIGRLRGLTDASASETSDLQSQLASLTIAMESSSGLVESTTSQLQQLRVRVEGYEVESARLKSECKRLTEELDASNKSVRDMRDKAAAHQVQLQSKERDYASMSAQYSAEQQARISVLERSIQSKATHIDALTKSIAQSSRALESANASFPDAINGQSTIDDSPALVPSVDENPTEQSEPTSNGTELSSEMAVTTPSSSLETVLTRMDASLMAAKETIERQQMQLSRNKEQLTLQEAQSHLKLQLVTQQNDNLTAEVQNLTKQLAAARADVIERDYQLQVMRDDAKVTEETSRLRESKLHLLQKSVDDTRQQYTSVINGQSKDPFGLAGTGSGFFSRSKVSQEQIDLMRESALAHQTHNAFLGQQLERIERERQQQEAVYSGMVSRLRKDLVARTAQMRDAVRSNPGSGTAKSESADWASGRIEELEAKLEITFRKYFISLVVGSKLQSYISGSACNIDAYDLYDKAMEQHILDPELWPNWVAQQIQESVATTNATR